MLEHTPARRTIVSKLPLRGFAPGTADALRALGYAIVPERAALGQAAAVAEAVVVDERDLGSLLAGSEATPGRIVVARASRGPRSAPEDPRIVGQVSRPADLAELYRVLQSALEATPREAPRVATELPVDCSLGRRRWTGALLSLSETGCLLRSAEEVASERLNLRFPLPLGRMIWTRGRVVRREGERLAVAFEAMAPSQGAAIRGYVQSRLGPPGLR